MEILQRRGAQLETRHRVSAAAIVDNRVVWSTGLAGSSPWRSAAKPFQLWCSLEALGDPQLSAVETALGASSHAGQPAHVEALRALQRRLGVREADLRCGAEPPLHRGSWEALLRAGQEPLDIHNDCSGKHSYFLAASAAKGWDGDYRDPDHPLQRRIATFAAERAGEAIGLSVDGCGVPVICLSIEGMARAWSWLGERMAAVGDPWTGQPRPASPGDQRAARIGWAMLHNPWWTSGDGRLDLEIARGAREPLVGKIGAGGVFCLALPQRGLGLAVKAWSGDDDALGVAVREALNAVAPGSWEAPADWERPILRNVVGRVVGDRVAMLGPRA